jgi:hypothetical protein
MRLKGQIGESVTGESHGLNQALERKIRDTWGVAAAEQ